MARIAGRGLRLYVGVASDTASAEPIAYISKWSFNQSTDNHEVTAGGDANKVYVAGLPDASGSFNGFYDDASAQTYTAASDGLARRFYLYPKTPSTAGPYWFGTALFDFNVEADVAGAVTLSGDFQAAGLIAKVG